VETAQFSVPDASYYGTSVAMSGELAVIGSDGRAFVHRFDGVDWTQAAELTVSDPPADGFGRTVAISGDVIVVGAPSAWGSAYVFVKPPGGWADTPEAAKLMASDAAAYDGFGISVAIDGHVALIGARYDDDGGSNTGSAYVFRYDTETSQWVEEQKLTASDAAAGDHYGASVVVNGNLAMIGAPFDDNSGNVSGSVYVVRADGSTWTEEQKLKASVPTFRFGGSTSIDGDVAVIGASGSAHVFRLLEGGWDEEAILPSPGYSPYYSLSVSIRGGVIVTGEPTHGSWGWDPGAAYVYREEGGIWVQRATLVASDDVHGQMFGASVSISGDVAIVGASEDHEYQECDLGCGTAYVFNHLADADGDGELDLCEIVSGQCRTSELVKLSASDGNPGDWFGMSVSISGDAALIGAMEDDSAEPAAGSLYVYRLDRSTWQWVEEAELTASDAYTWQHFGRSVGIDGDVAVTGAYGDDNAANNSGAVYVFRRDPARSQWVEEQKIIASDAAPMAELGVSVCIR
jgi:hypothetical protein